jgi:putative ABC transport system permease protein
MKSIFLKIFLRNIKKQKLIFFINLTGLILGIVSFIFIETHIKHELSYDKFQSHSDRIYRVLDLINDGSYIENSTSCPIPLGRASTFDCADFIDGCVRLYNNWGESAIITVGDKSFREKKFVYADPSLFNIFHFNFIHGNPSKSLDGPYKIVLTKSLARKIFGDDQCVGKTLKLNKKQEVEVSGVIEDMPANSHFHYNAFCSFETVFGRNDERVIDGWGWNPCWTYVKLKEGVTQKFFEGKLADVKQKHIPGHHRTFKLQPLESIHLNSHLDFEIEANSNELYIYILMCITISILIIVIVNYINQTTAMAFKRSREIGLKKVLGALPHALLLEFLLETILLSFIALGFSLILVVALISPFNVITGETFHPNDFFSAGQIVTYIGIAFVLGTLAGIYPSILLTSLDPIKAIKSSINGGGKQSYARKFLIISQYVISIIMVICTMTVFQQSVYLQTAATGFCKEQILLLDAKNTDLPPQYDAFIAELKKNSNIVNATGMQFLFGHNYNTNAFHIEGKHPYFILYPFNTIYYDFFETFDIPIIKGRAFNLRHASDPNEGIIINETMVKKLGWSTEEAIGKTFNFRDGNEKVIGVIRDFHYNTLKSGIMPLALKLETNTEGWSTNYIAVKLKKGDPQQTINYITQTWEKFDPGSPVEFFFLDSKLNSLYKSEVHLVKIASVFTAIAILICCLGILSLIIFLTKQKEKEVAIRLVLGSSTSQVVKLFSKDFLLLILIASMVAWPVAYVLVNNWLHGFASRITISWTLFLYASFGLFLITEIIVLYHAIRISRLNPTQVLKGA